MTPQLSTSGRLLVVRKGNRRLFYCIVAADGGFVAVLQFQTRETVLK